MSGRVIISRVGDIRRLWADSELTLPQVAEALSMSVDALQSRAVSLQLPPRKIGRREVIRPHQEAEFRILWQAGVAARLICMAFGCSYFAVIKTAERLQLPARGVAYRPRMTLDQVREVQLRLAMADDPASRHRVAP